MGLFDIFSNSDSNNAANAQIQAYQQANQQYQQDASQGRGALTQNYTAGLQPSLQNVGTANAGTNQLLQLLGIGGAGGAQGGQDISALLSNTPGYQFQLQQGNNAINAANAQGGKLGSGNNALDLANFNQGLAGTTYNNYVNQLQPFLGYGTQNAANVGQQYGNLGNALNSNYTGAGEAAYGSAVGQGNAQAQADYSQLAQSGQLWNLFGNLAKGGASAAGGGLFSGFGGTK
jgi:hypothetical protein